SREGIHLKGYLHHIKKFSSLFHYGQVGCAAHDNTNEWGHLYLPTNALYSSADINPDSSSASFTVTLMIQPSPNGSLFTSSGASSSFGFISSTSPPIGINRSDTVFTASMLPKTSPCSRVSPCVVTSTKTISPSSSCAKSV